MEEAIYTQLRALASVLHWLGKYPEMQVISSLAMKLEEADVRTWQEAIEFIMPRLNVDQENRR